MTSLGSEVAAAVFSAVAALIVLWAAIRMGFFYSRQGKKNLVDQPTLLLVAGAFLIYFGICTFTPSLLLKIFSNWMLNRSIELSALLNFLTGGAIIVAFALYMQAIYRPITQSILGSAQLKDLKTNILIALTACLVAYPLVICIGQILEIAVYLIFHTLQIPDQVAILFLKTTFGKPLYFFFATVSIIIFAPLIEELLFRGFLQSYLRRYMAAPWAIAISSLSFAFFHYSKDQGLGNIPIIGSLFVLANFLGFVYERQRTLLAPMILHAIFNMLSITNLYFFGI